MRTFVMPRGYLIANSVNGTRLGAWRLMVQQTCCWLGLCVANLDNSYGLFPPINFSPVPLREAVIYSVFFFPFFFLAMGFRCLESCGNGSRLPTTVSW